MNNQSRSVVCGVTTVLAMLVLWFLSIITVIIAIVYGVAWYF